MKTHPTSSRCASRHWRTSLAAGLALLCAVPATLQADTVLIYHSTVSYRHYYGSSKPLTETTRGYYLFDYTTGKVGRVSYFTQNGKKSYYVSPVGLNDDVLCASVPTSSSASSTYFVMTYGDSLAGGYRWFSFTSPRGVDKLMDLGGGHTGKFPLTATGLFRSVGAGPVPTEGSFVQNGTISLRLAIPLTRQANAADASLAASLKRVTNDLESRGYTKQ